MSNKSLGPAAGLLRNSRLFSLPPPLPKPMNDLMGHVQSNKGSDSATLPYPIQQAIATPPSSLSKGDWGMKRPLPLRSTTRTSTPILRVNAVDTREHITDFDSAADLSLSLDKFRQLHLSITTHGGARTQLGGSSSRADAKSVFEAERDHTSQNAAQRDSKDSQRWKFRGPWIAGMTEGEFRRYVQKELKGRKIEFQELLRGTARENLELSRSRRRRDDPDLDPPSVTERDVDEWIRDARSNFSLNSELARLISEFLDLPAMPVQIGNSKMSEFYNTIEDGPPATHPSAGLSYLRSDSVLENDSLFGPQQYRTPIVARVLTTAQLAGARSAQASRARVGVAGVVAHSVTGGHRIRAAPPPTEAESLDRDEVEGRSMGLNTPGGNRIWVEPMRASIDSRGRIQLDATNANAIKVGVHTGEVMAPVPSFKKGDDMGPLIPEARYPAGRFNLQDLARKPQAQNGPAGGRRRPRDSTGEIVASLDDMFKTSVRRRGNDK